MALLAQRRSVVMLKDLWWLAIIISLYYLIGLGSHGLIDPDEGRYSSVSVAMWQSGNWWLPTVNGVPFLDKPILAYWLQTLALHLFGYSLWALRFFPALLAIFACLGIYVAGHYCFTRRTGIFAAFILATCPLFFAVGHFANMDMEVASWLTLSLCSVLIALNSEAKLRRRRFMIAAYIFAAFAFLTKGLLGLVFPAAILFLWITWQQQWAWFKKLSLLTGLAIILVLSLPWLIIVQMKEPWFFHYYFVYQQFDRYLGGNYNQQQPVWFYVEMALAGAFPWSLYFLASLSKVWRGWREKQRFANEHFVTIWFLFILIFFSIPNSKLPGYITPLYAPMAILIARYWDVSIIQQRLKTLKGVYFLSIITWLLIGLFAIVLPHFILNSSLKALYHSLFGFGIVLILLSALGVLILKSLPKFWFLHTVTVMLVVGFFTLWVLPRFPTNTVQPLYEAAVPYLDSHTDVVSFDTYYYGLPVYLKRPVYVVSDWKDQRAIMSTDNWKRLLYVGSQQGPQAAQWLWDYSQFWHIWQSKPTIVFLPKALLNVFHQHMPGYVLLGQYRDNVVIINSLHTLDRRGQILMAAKSWLHSGDLSG